METFTVHCSVQELCQPLRRAMRRAATQGLREDQRTRRDFRSQAGPSAAAAFGRSLTLAAATTGLLCARRRAAARATGLVGVCLLGLGGCGGSGLRGPGSRWARLGDRLGRYAGLLRFRCGRAAVAGNQAQTRDTEEHHTRDTHHAALCQQPPRRASTVQLLEKKPRHCPGFGLGPEERRRASTPCADGCRDRGASRGPRGGGSAPIG